MAMHHEKANCLSLLGFTLLPLCAVVLCACGGCGTVDRGRTAVAGMATCMDPLSQCGNPWAGMSPLYGYQPTCWHAWPYPTTDCPCVFDVQSDTEPSATAEVQPHAAQPQAAQPQAAQPVVPLPATAQPDVPLPHLPPEGVPAEERALPEPHGPIDLDGVPEPTEGPTEGDGVSHGRRSYHSVCRRLPPP